MDAFKQIFERLEGISNYGESEEAPFEDSSGISDIEGAALLGVESTPRIWNEIISKIKKGRSVEVISPTGTGKTTLYKLTALNLNGSALVVIPTLSLARTQIEDLQKQGISAALWGHDAFSFKALPKFIFITPEAIQYVWGSNSFKLLSLHKADFSLLVFDEVHAIYMDRYFRPAFTHLHMLKLFFSDLPCYICSAPMRNDMLRTIEKSLGFEDLDLVRYKKSSILRKNLVISFHQFYSKREIREALLPFIACHKSRAGIVFVRTAKEVTIVRQFLKTNFQGVHVYPYHAKIAPSFFGFADADYKEGVDSIKRLVLERFMADEKGVLVSTSACAYGINCEHVGWVAFYGLPYSLNSFLQMSGRAGRNENDLAFIWCGYCVHEEDAFRARSVQEYRAPKRAFYRQQYEELLDVIHSATVCRMVAIEKALDPDAKTDPCGVCDVCRARQGNTKATLQLLQRLRARIAKETETPEALVLSKKTLSLLAEKTPKNQEELMRTKGIGPVKCEKYGERILEVINDSALF